MYSTFSVRGEMISKDSAVVTGLPLSQSGIVEDVSKDDRGDDAEPIVASLDN